MNKTLIDRNIHAVFQSIDGDGIRTRYKCLAKRLACWISFA